MPRMAREPNVVRAPMLGVLQQHVKNITPFCPAVMLSGDRDIESRWPPIGSIVIDAQDVRRNWPACRPEADVSLHGWRRAFGG